MPILNTHGAVNPLSRICRSGAQFTMVTTSVVSSYPVSFNLAMFQSSAQRSYFALAVIGSGFDQQKGHRG